MSGIDPWTRRWMERMRRADQLAAEAYENMLKPGLTDFERDEYRRQLDHYNAEKQRLEREYSERS